MKSGRHVRIDHSDPDTLAIDSSVLLRRATIGLALRWIHRLDGTPRVATRILLAVVAAFAFPIETDLSNSDGSRLRKQVRPAPAAVATVK